MAAGFVRKLASSGVLRDFMGGQGALRGARSRDFVEPEIRLGPDPVAVPIEPPLGVGPTEEIFGPLGPPGPPLPSRRLPDPGGFTTPSPFIEPILPSTAARVAPGYADVYPLLQNLGVPPIELGRTSRFDWARTPPAASFRLRKNFVGLDPGGEALYEVVQEVSDSATWLRSSSEIIRKIEAVLASGVDELGRNIDRTLVTRNVFRNGSFIEQTETVPLRKIYEERNRAQRAGAARWWITQRETGGPGFDKEFEWLAIKDPATDERVAIELFDKDGRKISVPTARIDLEDPDQIFVFGSNLEGVHGAGAAREAAQKWGAQAGVGRGLTGRAYALPTKKVPTNAKRQFEIFELELYVDELLETARANPTKKFMITPFGTGLAGYELEEIAKIFARVAANEMMPPNVFFTDINEKGAEIFVATIARERGKILDELVTVDVEKLLELERRFFGDAALGSKKAPVQSFDLPELPAPSILAYAEEGANQVTRDISKLIKDTVARGDRDNARVLQAYTLRRLEAARTPRAIVTALKDYRELAPLVERKGVFGVAFRDSIETAMENLGALNKQAAADTYVYLAEEVVDSRKLASYIDGYISKAETFDELLQARFWLDDVFVSSKISHPELLLRNEWSRAESRLIDNIENRIVTLRNRSSKYLKKRGADLVSYRSGLTEPELRKMFSEAIGTSRSIHELRLIYGLMNKYELAETLRQDLNVMIRTIRPIVAARRKVPVKDKELRRSRISELSKYVSTSADPKKAAAGDVKARARGAEMAGEEPFYSDIIGWEEGKQAYNYLPYNPDTLLRGSTQTQKEWILRESPDFVRALRLTVDLEELKLLANTAFELKSNGTLSGRMWKYLEKEIATRKSVVLAYYKRTGRDIELPDPDKVDLSSVIAWARANESSRRQSTRYWNDPDIEKRTDFSDFVQNNPLYDQLIHDGQMLDAMSGRSVRGLSDNDLMDNPFLDFDDGLGDISIARGDISGEIIESTNRRYWEISEQINSIEETIKKGEDYLGRNIATEKVVKTLEGGATKEITLQELLEERRAGLIKDRMKIERQDMAWYNDENQSALPFGVRRIVNPTNPDEEMVQVFDFEFGIWYKADEDAVQSMRSTNRANPDRDLSEAIFPKGEDSTLVYQSARRSYVGPDGKPFEVRPLVRIFVPDGEGYVYRTFINAYGSDATVAVASDFDSFGEKLTKKFANGGTLRYNFKKGQYTSAPGRGRRTRYVGVEHQAADFDAEVNRVIDQLNEAHRMKNDSPITVNFAGNSSKTLGEAVGGRMFAQEAADQFAYDLMRAVMEHPRRTFVIANARSGGQNGYDQAFMKAMIRLGIPIDVTLPRARYGGKVMVQGPDESEYLTISEYLKSLGFQREPVTSTLKPLRSVADESGKTTEALGYTFGQPVSPERWEASTAAPASQKIFKRDSSGSSNRPLSALIMRLQDGRTIEEAYQLDIKGYRSAAEQNPNWSGSERYKMWMEGKDKTSLNGHSREELEVEYKNLWRRWFEENPDQLELARRSIGDMVINDVKARKPGGISQSKTIRELLNELPETALAPTSRPVMSMPMNFKDGTRGLIMAPGNEGKSTMDLIAEGKRTATTRASKGQFNKSDGSELSVGDVIEVFDKDGTRLMVEVTKAPYQLPSSADVSVMDRYRNRWSALEGWDPSMYDNYAGQWQIQYKLLGS